MGSRTCPFGMGLPFAKVAADVPILKYNIMAFHSEEPTQGIMVCDDIENVWTLNIRVKFWSDAAASSHSFKNYSEMYMFFKSFR